MSTKTSLVKPYYRQSYSAIEKIVDGVEFKAYRVGVLQYTRISTDGRAEVRLNYDRDTYTAYTLDGPILAASGKPKAFRYFETAARAALSESSR